MTISSKQEGNDLILERILDAPIQRVWDANVKADQLKQWHSAGDGWTTPFVNVDLQVGGIYEIAYHDPEGKDSFTLSGTYKEITEPTKLVYTIGDDRLVTITMEALGEQTRYTLRFTLETENSAELQRQGWTAILESMTAFLDKA